MKSKIWKALIAAAIMTTAVMPVHAEESIVPDSEQVQMDDESAEDDSLLYAAGAADDSDAGLMQDGLIDETETTVNLEETESLTLSDAQYEYNGFTYLPYTESRQKINGRWTRVTDHNTVTITGYQGSESILAIPASIDGKAVTTIADDAFKGNTTLVGVSFPDSLTKIGSEAFSGCTGLTDVFLPSTVKSVGENAFQDCSLLKLTVEYDGSHLPFLDEAKDISKIVFKGTITAIPDNAFEFCQGVTEITIPETVTSIGASAFGDCRDLKKVVIPSSVKSIGSYAFAGCSALKDATIPPSVESIGDHAFYFSGLEQVTIPASVTSFGTDIFHSASLTSATISEGSSVIDYYMFAECSSLKTVTVPASVRVIRDGAFYKCTALTDIIYAGEEANWKNVSIGSFNDGLEHVSLHFKDHSFGAWHTTIVPTTTAEGQEARSCTACGYRETRAVAKLPASAQANSPAISKAPASAQANSPAISKAPSSVKVKAAAKGKVTVSWRKIKSTKKTKALLKQIKKVEIQYSTKKDFSSAVKLKKISGKKTIQTLKLAKKKTYYIRVRYSNGKGGYSNWSAVKKVKTKK